MLRAWEHFKTITRHRHLVMRGCFKIGLYKQGFLHDLSKYSPVEFGAGMKYWTGKESPNNGERRATGLSQSWLHHKGRNKHHIEYWIDYSMGEGSPIAGMKMPIRYVCEMFVDRVSACKNYQGKNYTDKSALEYYLKGKDHTIIHPDTAELLHFLLSMLAEKGEDETFRFIKTKVLKRKGSEYGKGYESFI